MFLFIKFINVDVLCFLFYLNDSIFLKILIIVYDKFLVS